jgi:CO/xanthine dehydrogenase Mo-binding subunit
LATEKTFTDKETNPRCKTTGQVAMNRIVCAHDCGLMVNPDGVMNQVKGNIVQGVSRAMYEKLPSTSPAPSPV